MSDRPETPTFDDRLADLARAAAGLARPESGPAVRLRARHRVVRRRVATGAAAVVVLGGLAAAGALRPASDGQAPTTVTPTTVASPTPAAPSTLAASPAPTRSAPSATPTVPRVHTSAGTAGTGVPADTSGSAPPRCTTAQLDVTLGGEDSGSGHCSVAIVFRNSGPTACRLTGYPGVDALDGNGTAVAHARRTPSGYLGGLGRGQSPPTVTLPSGGSASAMVEALGFAPDGSAACEPYSGLLVTPPDDVRSVRLTWTTDSCSGLEVHPVVAGTTGRRP